MQLQRRHLLALAAASASPLALAQARPIRLIVPYAAGGPIDVTARLLAERVKDTLGTVVIENRPGGGGNIGADAVAKAAPDGLTIGIAAVATHAINPWLFAKMPYDASRDFAPITQMVRVPNVLVMNADTAARLKIQTLADLIVYAKANPARLNYGSGGNGSAGKLQAQGVTTHQASPTLPDVPPIAQTLRGFAIDTWRGLVAPAGTPRETVQHLNQAFVAALQSPEAKTRFAQLMAEPVTTTPEEFGSLIRAELVKYERVVKASGAKVD